MGFARDSANRHDYACRAGGIPDYCIGRRRIAVVALRFHKCVIDESGGAFEFALGRTRRIAGQSPSANSAEQSSNRRRGRARCLETNSRFRDEEGDRAVGIVARPGQGSASLRLRDYKHSRQTRVGPGDR